MAQVAQPSGSKERRKRHSTHMDMTPMVDLAFLLLTFFILTVTLADPYILKVEMPDERAGKQQPVNAKQVLTLVLGEKDKVYWYQGLDNSKLELTDFSKNGVRKILLEKNRQIEGRGRKDYQRRSILHSQARRVQHHRISHFPISSGDEEAVDRNIVD